MPRQRQDLEAAERSRSWREAGNRQRDIVTASGDGQLEEHQVSRFAASASLGDLRRPPRVSFSAYWRRSNIMPNRCRSDPSIPTDAEQGDSNPQPPAASGLSNAQPLPPSNPQPPSVLSPGDSLLSFHTASSNTSTLGTSRPTSTTPVSSRPTSTAPTHRLVHVDVHNVQEVQVDMHNVQEAFEEFGEEQEDERAVGDAAVGEVVDEQLSVLQPVQLPDQAAAPQQPELSTVSVLPADLKTPELLAINPKLVAPNESNSAPLIDPNDSNLAPPIDPNDSNSAPPIDPNDSNSAPPMDPKDRNSLAPIDPNSPNSAAAIDLNAAAQIDPNSQTPIDPSLAAQIDPNSVAPSDPNLAALPAIDPNLVAAATGTSSSEVLTSGSLASLDAAAGVPLPGSSGPSTPTAPLSRMAVARREPVADGAAVPLPGSSAPSTPTAPVSRTAVARRDPVAGTSSSAVPSAPKRSRIERRKKFRKRKSPYVESDSDSEEDSSADENASFPTRFSPRNKRGYRY